MGIWFVTKPRALNGTNRRGSLLAADLVDTSCRSFFLGGGESSRMAELGTTMSLAVEGFSDFFEGHKSVYGTALILDFQESKFSIVHVIIQPDR